MIRTPNTDAMRGDSRQSPATTPIWILSIVAALVVLFVIFVPQQRTDPRAIYSSYGTGDGGTRALYETLDRVGFDVARNEKALTAQRPDTNSIYALINPAQPLTATELNILIGAVRHGAILIFTMDGSDLADSLGFKSTQPADGFFTLGSTVVAGGNPALPDVKDDPQALFQQAFPIGLVVKSDTSYSDNQPFLWLAPSRTSKAAKLDSTRQQSLILGHPFGNGYAIAINPPAIVMNRVIRLSRPAIAVVRAIDYASALRHSGAIQPRTVVFDEYHHGFGQHADMVAAIRDALITTPAGRMTVEVIVAALILLLAFGVRPLAPVPTPAVSRRSPLEHVSALAYAYSQIDARKLGTSWLVRGLRRRHSLGLARSLPDADYLTALQSRLTSASQDVDYVTRALAADTPDSSDRFARVGAAIANIERAFQQ